MSTSLQVLLAKLAPECTIGELSAVADRALNTYPVEGATVSGSAMLQCLARFVWHLDNLEYQAATPLPYNPAVYEGRVHALLKVRYGSDPLVKASDRARLGLDGGLRSVLQELAEEWRNRKTRERIRLIVAASVGAMSLSQRLAAMEEYGDKFAHLLPPEYLESGRLGVKLNFVRILEGHPFALEALHQTGR